MPRNSYPPGPWSAARLGSWLKWDEFAAANIPRVAPSTWLIVLALGRTNGTPGAPEPPPILLATDDFRTLPGPLPLTLLVLSRLPALGLDDGVLDMWSFCWCLNSRSRRAKHLVHSGHSKGFSFVWERSWRFRCSNLANDLEQVHLLDWS